jgi:MFS family permease
MTVLRHRDFRNLFLGQSLSTFGDRIVFVALALFVTEIGSPTDVGLVLAAHAVPLVGFILLGGVVADRIARTRVMIASDAARCALHALLAALIFTGVVEVWHIVVIEALYGCAEAFFKPAQTGLLPQTVPEDEIQPARAASGTIETVAEFAGPALATVLVLGLGAGWAFAIDAATFLVSIAFLLRVRPRERGEAAPAQTVLADLRDGWRAVRERAWLWSILLCFSAAVLLSFAPWFTLGPTVAEDVYGSTGVFGVLVAAAGVGTIAGAVTGFRWRPLHPLRTGMLLALMWPASMLAVALGLPLGVVVPGCVLAGFGIALFGIWWETALAQRVPPHLLSRVSAYDWMVSLSLLPIGYLLAGPLGEALGEQAVLAVGTAAATLALAAGLLVRETRTLRRLEHRAAA